MVSFDNVNILISKIDADYYYYYYYTVAQQLTIGPWSYVLHVSR
jgi:hypothetical protein